MSILVTKIICTHCKLNEFSIDKDKISWNEIIDSENNFIEFLYKLKTMNNCCKILRKLTRLGKIKKNLFDFC